MAPYLMTIYSKLPKREVPMTVMSRANIAPCIKHDVPTIFNISPKKRAENNILFNINFL